MIEVSAQMNDRSHTVAAKRPASFVPKVLRVAYTNDALENEYVAKSDAGGPLAKRVKQGSLL